MNNITAIILSMTHIQRAAYELICEKKSVHAVGQQVKTYRSLAKRGLVKLNRDAQQRNVYVLSGEPPKELKKIKVPLTKEVVKRIVSNPNNTNPPEPIKKLTRPPATYSNISREQHVERILNIKL